MTAIRYSREMQLCFPTRLSLIVRVHSLWSLGIDCRHSTHIEQL